MNRPIDDIYEAATRLLDTVRRLRETPEEKICVEELIDELAQLTQVLYGNSQLLSEGINEVAENLSPEYREALTRHIAEQIDKTALKYVTPLEDENRGVCPRCKNKTLKVVPCTSSFSRWVAGYEVVCPNCHTAFTGADTEEQAVMKMRELHLYSPEVCGKEHLYNGSWKPKNFEFVAHSIEEAANYGLDLESPTGRLVASFMRHTPVSLKPKIYLFRDRVLAVYNDPEYGIRHGLIAERK